MKKKSEMPGMKFDSDRPRLDLLPFAAIEEIGKVLKFGAQKYEENNWRKDLKISRYIRASLSHIFAHMRGEDLDQESGLHHLSHAACSVLMALELFLLERQERDDRFFKGGKDGRAEE